MYMTLHIAYISWGIFAHRVAELTLNPSPASYATRHLLEKMFTNATNARFTSLRRTIESLAGKSLVTDVRNTSSAVRESSRVQRV